MMRAECWMLIDPISTSLPSSFRMVDAGGLLAVLGFAEIEVHPSLTPCSRAPICDRSHDLSKMVAADRCAYS
jgi:hypothetical protein